MCLCGRRQGQSRVDDGRNRTRLDFRPDLAVQGTCNIAFGYRTASPQCRAGNDQSLGQNTAEVQISACATEYANNDQASFRV